MSASFDQQARALGPSPSILGSARAQARLAALLLPLLVYGCREDERQRTRPEAAALVRLVSALREAKNDAKGVHLDALRSAPCSVPDLCGLKDRCVTAYSGQVQAMKRIAAIKSSIEQPPPGAAQDNAGILVALDAAEQGLARAREGTVGCADLEAKVTERYELR